MNKLILSLGVVSAALVVANGVEAKNGSPQASGHQAVRPQPSQHIVKPQPLNHQTITHPINHQIVKPNAIKIHTYPKTYRGWDRHYWHPNYRCCFFWNQMTNCWYYWYQPCSCYYPMTYIESYPPTTFTSQAVQMTDIASMNVEVE